MLVINNLSKKIGAKIILSKVSLQVPRGHIALLLGSSGAGKSTLLRILNGLESYDTGSLMLDGKPLDVRSVHKTHTIGMVFQHFNLFEHMTVLQNCTLALEKVLGKSKQEAESIAYTLFTHYGLADKANQYPAQLSGGQKQRLALIRTLAMQPSVICLDEPTSALDPVLKRQVATNIKQLAHEGLIVLVASHDIGLVEQLPCTIYLMEDAAIVEVADSQEFANNPKKYPRIESFIAGSKYISE